MEKPKHYHVRRPTDMNQKNGQVVNPPNFPEMGGFTGPGKVNMHKGNFKIIKPKTR